jgi:hypothetical protein
LAKSNAGQRIGADCKVAGAMGFACCFLDDWFPRLQNRRFTVEPAEQQAGA